jgi:hypothetical protein
VRRPSTRGRQASCSIVAVMEQGLNNQRAASGGAVCKTLAGSCGAHACKQAASTAHASRLPQRPMCGGWRAAAGAPALGGRREAVMADHRKAAGGGCEQTTLARASSRGDGARELPRRRRCSRGPSAAARVSWAVTTDASGAAEAVRCDARRESTSRRGGTTRAGRPRAVATTDSSGADVGPPSGASRIS